MGLAVGTGKVTKTSKTRRCHLIPVDGQCNVDFYILKGVWEKRLLHILNDRVRVERAGVWGGEEGVEPPAKFSTPVLFASLAPKRSIKPPVRVSDHKDSFCNKHA